MTKSHRWATWAGWIVAGALLLTGSVAGASYAGFLGPRITAEELIADNGLHAVDATNELCGDGRLSCVEAWRTDVGDYLRFSDAGAAREWEVVLGDDGRRWKLIVLDMHERDLSFEQRRRAVEILYGYHDWG